MKVDHRSYTQLMKLRKESVKKKKKKEKKRKERGVSAAGVSLL